MSEDEMIDLYNQLCEKFFAPVLEAIQSDIEFLREDIRKEREDLRMRAENAEAELKLYKGLFSKLNLNMEVKND